MLMELFPIFTTESRFDDVGFPSVLDDHHFPPQPYSHVLKCLYMSENDVGHGFLGYSAEFTAMRFCGCHSRTRVVMPAVVTLSLAIQPLVLPANCLPASDLKNLLLALFTSTYFD